ncbi:MAG TPA: hypothetical protein VEB19_09245 [Gemmatimonadaceae bacterium]|nr:hypothetical protein [Gemmatimonadaceae bacterium]
MKLLSQSSQVGVYICPRGVFGVECRPASGGVEVVRMFGEPFALRTPAEAAEQLVAVMAAAGIARADIAATIRGFGAAHHTLQLPPAPDSVLGPVIEREVRRLEPHLTDCVIQWMSLPALDSGPTTAPPQRSVFAMGVPTDTIRTLETVVAASGHSLRHVTALPVAMQRLLDQFDSGTGTIATVVPLPDGAYIGFSLSGGVRLIVEPPLPSDISHEAAALAEEVDLAAMFVRQQFRGANTDRVVLIGARQSLSELKTSLAERLRIPIKQLEAESLTPVGFVALGAVLDARSDSPQSLGGKTRLRAASRGMSRLETASYIAIVLLALVGFWTAAETVRSVRAGTALETARRRLERDAFGLAPARATAEQRRIVRNALAAVQLASADRVRLQTALSRIADVARAPVHLDSLRMLRADDGWRAVMTGNVRSSSNARAVQALHDLYRDLPQRLPIDSLRLDRLSYPDGEQSDETGVVRFQLSFGITARPAER